MRIFFAVLSLTVGVLFFWKPAYAQLSDQSLFSTQQPFIITPAPGEVILGKNVEVRFRLPLDFIPEQNGFVWVWLDPVSGRTTINGQRVPLNQTQINFINVPSGLHTVWVELRNLQAQAFDPPYFERVEFETIAELLESNVQPPAPDLALKNPTFTATDRAFLLIVVGILVGLMGYNYQNKK